MADTNILVVEDNSIVAEDIQRILEGIGYHVSGTASSYAEAIEATEATHPDIVLMDIKLAGEKTGIEAADVIRREMNLPVVFLTAHSDVRTLDSAKKTNPYGYLLKPFNAAELQTAVEMALYRFRLEDRLRRSEAWLSTTLRSIGDAIIATDPAGEIVFMNQIAEQLTGWVAPDASHHRIEEVFNIVNASTRETLVSPVYRALSERTVVGLEKFTHLIRRDGSEIPVGDSASPIQDERGEVLGAVLVFRDSSEMEGSLIEHGQLQDHIKARSAELARANEDLERHIVELQRAEERIQRQAYHDALTGLPNRLLFVDRLQMAMAGAMRSNVKMAILLVHLDRFNWINDTVGRSVGDKLIQETALRLQGLVREVDTLARQSGHEFMLLLQATDGVLSVLPVIERIQRAFEEQPLVVLGAEYFVSVSVGATLFPDDAESAELLVQNAESALHRARDSGSGSFQLFDPGMQRNAQDRLVMDSKFRSALRDDEFLLHYQPQYDSRTGRIVGFEALIRWNDPELGMVPPMKFIPLAEDTGMIIRIGEWVVRRALRTTRSWLDEGLALGQMAVNISARQFQSPGFPDWIAAILDEFGLPPGILELELTESVLMQNVERTADRLRALSDMGVKIAVDDFGTGYSSLNYVRILPVSKLKIDRSFVSDLPGTPRESAIVRAIIAMAEGLEKSIIAEGVETEAQVIFLKEQRCFEMQGFYFSRPVTEDAARLLLM